jgi:signal transduction histidine kinase/DNA-binding NarL/FixJ family response regulator/HPt (histidine-containing phosphotransfer) domain-containing protein
MDNEQQSRFFRPESDDKASPPSVPVTAADNVDIENAQLFSMVMNLQAQNHQLMERVQQLKQERDVLTEQVQELEYSIVKANQLAITSDMANLFKTQFLANMSHDIRTPLNGVIGMAKLLSETSLTGDQIEFAQSIINSGEALLSLINDILDISKIEAGELVLEATPFDLRVLLQRMMVPLKILTKKKQIDFRIEYAEDAPSQFIADEHRLAQVINNLAGNAIKFTDHGYVAVRIFCLEKNDDQAVMRVEVADTGVGIPESAQSVIFEKFKQADASTTRRYGGTGLGLAISKQLVEMMSGTLCLVSEEEVGSTFFFEIPLPLAKTPVVASDRDQADDTDDAPRTLDAHILLVEDSLTNQQVAGRVIENNGCSVVIANNGQEALDILSREAFDLIFMDCQMPVMDGYEATRIIRKQQRGKGVAYTPIVALTANVLPAEKAKCIEAGMDDYITKPIDFDEVRKTIVHYTGKYAEKVLMPPQTPSTTKPRETKAISDEFNTLPVIEQKRLQDVCGEDTDLVEDILSSFLSDVGAELESLRDSITHQDMEAIRKSAHKIKGAAANIGAERLSRVGLKMQLAVDKGTYQCRPEDIHPFVTEFEALKQAIAQIEW